jgi:signal transduction histidine kinase
MLRLDLVLAAVLASCEFLLWVLGPRQYWPPSWVVALPWFLLAYVAIVVRRVYLWAAVALLAVHGAISAVVTPLSTGGIPMILLIYTVAATLALRPAALGSLLLWLPPVALMVVMGRTRSSPLNLDPTYFVVYNLMGALVVFFIGRTVFNRRAYVRALEDRARSSEYSLRALAEQSVADERRRIARELHDVVAHHVSVMSVLATGSRRALHHDPAAADEALATIEETGRVALREMRRMLSVLRTDAEPAGELEPQPGLPGLEALCEQIREAGLPVTLSSTGDPGNLDPGIALTVYRVAQEALTNALKHAGPASAEVRLAFTPKELTIDVSDNGRGPHPGGDPLGHGLVGMRERISLYGGTLRTGPRPGGGFRVSVCIPLDPAGALA